jgi:hypothetical protein
MSGTYNHNYNGGSWIDKVRRVSTLPPQSLATSSSISTLTNNRGAVT